MNEEQHYTFDELVALLESKNRIDRFGESALVVMERVNRLGSVAAAMAETLREVEHLLDGDGDGTHEQITTNKGPFI